MHIPLRSFATFLLAVGVATCSDTHSTALAPEFGPNGSGVARLGFQPVFSEAARAAFVNLADFNIDFDHVRVAVVRPPAETVKDTLVAFRPGQAPITLDLTVSVRIPGEVFKVTVDYVTTQTVVFHGEGTVASHAPDQPAPQQQITIEYKGPGFNVARVVVAPKTVKVVSPTPTTFTFTAFDAANAAVTNVPINWTSSDATIATISAAGVLTPTGKRGTVTVTALTPNNVSDNGSASITLPATSIALVSGGGQTGKAGGALAQAAVVKVLASDGVGVADVTVNFAAPTGGKVGSATVTTDANGQATTSLTLGGALGPQSFVAAAGSFSVAIPATATAGDPASITPSSGGGQADTVRHVLKNPLVAKVVDQFGNPVANVAVAWTRTGTGTLSATSSTTSADGSASVGYTLGNVVGTETISAAVAGIATPATFAVQALSAGPAAITLVSGTGQSGRAGQPLSAPFVVHVADDAGNAVSGATVSWTAVNGTIPATTTTDAQGNTSNTLTLGTTIGNATATATVSGKSVTFTAVVQVGIVAKLAFRANPPNGAVGQSLTPAVQVELQDAGGNRTAAVNAVTIAIGANPGKATLTGTLTRAAVAGVATFDDVRLSAAGTGYTLVASSAGVPNITSGPFTIGGEVTAIILIRGGNDQAAVVNTAVEVSPQVRVTDVEGGSLAGVPVTFTPSAGTVSPSTPVITDSEGFATLRSWTLGQTAGPQTLTVSTPGAANVTFNATGIGGPPAKLAITTQPSATATSGVALTTQPVIQVLDQFGNPSDGIDVFQVGAVWSPGSERNNLAFASRSGVAVFTALTLTGAGTGPVVFSGPNVQSVSSNPVTVSPAAANTMLVIDPTTGAPITGTIPPVTVTAGATLPATTPVIQVVDANGKPVAGVQVVVSVTGPVPGSNTFTTNAAGIIPFLGITAPQVAGTYTITATGTGLTGSPRSATVTVVPGPAAFHQWIQQPVPNFVYPAGQPLPTFTVGLFDQFNNAVSTNGISINVALDKTNSTNQNGQLSGTVTVQTVNGVATFTTLLVTGNGTGYRLNASNFTTTATPGAVFSNPFGIGTPPPPTLVTSLTPTITSTVGTPIPTASFPSFKLTDNSGASVPGILLTFTFAGTSVCVPTNPNSTTATTDANGIATLTPAQITFASSAAGSCLVTANAPSAFDINTAFSSIIFAPAAPVKTWTGATDNIWSTAGNWLPNGAPSASDQVFIPGWIRLQPTLTVSAAVGSMTLEPLSIANINLSGSLLQINGSLAATTTSGGIFNTSPSTGGVVMNAPGASTISGIVFATITIGPTSCGSTAYTVNGQFSAGGLIVNCPLDLGGQTIGVTGNLNTAGSGSIKIAQTTSGITVGGNATFQGASEVGLMTDGAIVLGGNLTMDSQAQFAPTGSNGLAFNGQGTRTVRINGGTTAQFQNVSILPGTNLTFSSPNAFNLTINGIFNHVGTLTVPAGTSITMTGSSTLGTLNFGGTTTVNGVMTLGGGASFLQGSSTTGTGAMTAALPCQKSANANVGVGPDPALPTFFRATACTQTP